jgi:tetratricopeptide (TPR) repeat protein
VNKIVLLIFGLLLFICPVSGELHAQQQKIDSLVEVLATTSRDTNRVQVLYSLADIYEKIDNNESLKYARQGLLLSRELKYDKGIDLFLIQIGICYYQKGNFDSALVNYQTRLDRAVAKNDSMGMAFSMDNIGAVMVHTGEHDKALELRKKANEIYFRAKDTLRLANGYVWIGNIYKEKGAFGESLSYFFKAKRLFERLNNSYSLGIALINISSIYREIKQYDLAIEYALRAIDLFTKTGDQNLVGISMYRLALVYDITGNPEEAVKKVEEARNLFLQTGNMNYLNLTTGYLGSYYLNKGDYDKALDYINNCLDIAKTANDMLLVGSSLGTLAFIYDLKKDYLSALDYSKRTIEVYHTIGNKPQLLEVYKLIVFLHSNLKQRDSVERYFQLYVALNDTLFNEKTIKTVAEVQEKYQAEKREKEIALLNLENEKKQFSLNRLEQENRIANLELMQAAIENEKSHQDLQLANAERENQKNQINILKLNEEVREQKLQQEKKEKTFLIVGFVVLFLAVGVIIYYILISYRNKKQKEEARLKQEAAELSHKLVETNMKAINFQLNPHFIFNCVHTVEYLLGQSKVKESMACLREFSDLIRMMLESMSKKEIPLERELDILRLYMDLEKMRHSHDFSYTIETDIQIDPVITMVPPLILQPFVENSIKHGFVQEGKAYHIWIRLQADGGKLHCQITDNGVGFSTKKDQISVSGFKKESLGLKLTEDRLRLINQMTRSEASWSIRDVKDENNTTGTVVSLQLPYILAA